MRGAFGMCRIENEYGVRDLPWIGSALRHLDLSSNAWLATHHAYGLLGANDGSGAAVNPGAANPGAPRRWAPNVTRQAMPRCSPAWQMRRILNSRQH